MITTYSFDLYGKLVSTDTFEDRVSGTPLSYLIKEGITMEFEIEGTWWHGVINKVNYFPPNANGDEFNHIFLRGLSEKANKEEE